MANYYQSVQGGRSLRLCVLSVLWESSRVYGYGGRRHLYSQRPRRPCLVNKRSTDLLHDPWYNKGTSFPATERDRLGLRGLLPPRIMTFEQQYERFMGNFRSLERQTKEGADDMVSLAKWRILNRLHDRNETLYYKVLIDNIEEFAPIIYTPTIGLVCQRYSGLFRRPRGMYFTAKDRGEMMSMIYNWPAEQVDMIVVTDGSRVLGLGDLGVQGIGISVGKLDVYVAAAGINPQRVMPVMIDVGTDNEKLLDNPQYLGIAQRRLEGEEYVAVVDEFMDAVFTRWPDVIVQFEDFQNKWAFRLLQRYRHYYRMFNDDVQGTAGVTLAGLFGAVRAKGLPISEIANQKIVVAGAGRSDEAGAGCLLQLLAEQHVSHSGQTMAWSLIMGDNVPPLIQPRIDNAGVGVVSMVKQAMARMQGNNSTANTMARGNFWLLDRQGLVTKSRADLNIAMKEFARDSAESQMEGGLQDGAGLLEVVNKVKPDVLLGLSGVGGIFTKEVLEIMKTSGCPRPAIFPLSNPTSNAECTAKEAFQYGGPNIIFASGSPFKDVELGNGNVGKSNQGNNMYLFPGIGLGTLLSGAHHISDGMLHAAAESLASIMTEENLRQGVIFPSISRIREITAQVAAAVLKEAVKEDLAAGYRHVDIEELQQMIQDDEETLSYVERQMWLPEYSSLVFHQ